MKQRRDITLGEMQDECKKYWNNGNLGSCGKCQYMEVCCHYEDYAPARLNLTDPPRFTEAQMAFWRGWYEIGARRARRNGTRIYLTLDNGDYFGSFEYGCISDKVKHGLQEEEIIVIAELLGKDGSNAG